MLWKLLLFSSLVWVASCARKRNREEHVPDDPLHISAFNIQILGKKKMKNHKVVEILVKIISKFDLVMIQEIRDRDEEALPQLFQDVNKYSGGKYFYIFGPRSGRSSSKEQYAYIYRRDKLHVTQKYQYQDIRNYFERPPYVVEFERKTPGRQKDFTFIPLHAKPTDAVNEMKGLFAVYKDSVKETGTMDSIIGGDLNADCGYVKSWHGVELRDPRVFKWWIGDNADTTVSSSNCAYDRIITTGSVSHNGCGAWVFRFDQEYHLNRVESKEVSDHYPVVFCLK